MSNLEKLRLLETSGALEEKQKVVDKARALFREYAAIFNEAHREFEETLSSLQPLLKKREKSNKDECEEIYRTYSLLLFNFEAMRPLLQIAADNHDEYRFALETGENIEDFVNGSLKIF